MEIRDGGAYYVSPADALLSGSTSDFAPAILSAATKFGVRIITFTISGALQRFDDRGQLVLQEATAVTTAYDHLGLFEGASSANSRTSSRNMSSRALYLPGR